MDRPCIPSSSGHFLGSDCKGKKVRAGRRGRERVLVSGLQEMAKFEEGFLAI